MTCLWNSKGNMHPPKDNPINFFTSKVNALIIT